MATNYIPYGTAGFNWGGVNAAGEVNPLTTGGSTESREDIEYEGSPTFTVNGIEYSRIHGEAGSANDFAEYKPFMTGPQDQAIYDETYGWGVPLPVLERGVQAGAFDKESTLDKLGHYGPLIAGGLLAATVAPAVMAGAAGAEAGAAGFEGATAADLAMETGLEEISTAGLYNIEPIDITWDYTAAANDIGITDAAFDTSTLIDPFVTEAADTLPSAAPSPESVLNPPAQSVASQTGTAGSVSPDLTGLNASATGPITPTSWWQNLMNWGEKNQQLSTAITNVGGGLLYRSFAPTPEETYQALYEAQLAKDLALAEDRRRNNNLSGINLNRIKPTGAAYSSNVTPASPRAMLAKSGLINNAMRRP